MSPASPTLIRDMFEKLVPGYDRFNRLSSLGLDVLWRRELIDAAKGSQMVLDVGTGTGDVALGLAAQGAGVVGVDFSDSMIQAAREKSKGNSSVSFQVASADRLPMESNTFDGLTSAFVIRNLNFGGILGQSMREFNRVMKPGGKMVHLELTRPPNGFVSWGHGLYLKSVLPIIGRFVFKEKWPKGYLQGTIESFPTPQEVCERIRWAGFQNVSHYPLSNGIASLFCGIK